MVNLEYNRSKVLDYCYIFDWNCIASKRIPKVSADFLNGINLLVDVNALNWVVSYQLLFMKWPFSIF